MNLTRREFLHLAAASGLGVTLLGGTRPVLAAMSDRWQIVSQRIAISTGQIVSCRDLTQSMKFRLCSGEIINCSSLDLNSVFHNA